MVSSARNPNESYAQRAKKASSSSTPRTTPQSPPTPATAPAPAPAPVPAVPPNVKAAQGNVWQERIREQKALAPPPALPSPPRPARDDPIPPRSPAPDLTAQLAILDQQDEHDPFVIRVPPHLSRQSSSGTNPLPVTDSATWPHLASADNPPPNYDSPFLPAAPSSQNSTASFRHHAPASARLSRVRSSFSQNSHSASQSREQSRSGSSASSPRLQIRPRTLPDDPLLPDLRLDTHLPASSKKRSSPDPPNHISPPFLQDAPPPPGDPYYRRPPVQDMPPRYFLPQYTFPPTHVPGHASPPYIPPHSVQGTYPHFPPYPAYMYAHPSLFWAGDVPHPLSQNHFQNHSPILPNHVNAPECSVPHNTEFGSISPAVMTESVASEHRSHGQNGWQPKPSKSVIFGTINLAEGQDGPTTPPNNEQPTDATVEHVTEQFGSILIGLRPDEPGPSRLSSRKSSVRSLPKIFSQPTTNDGTKEADSAPPPRELNGSRKPNKWEFGTTHREDLDDPNLPLPPSLPSPPPPRHPNVSAAVNVDDQSDLVGVPPLHDSSRLLVDMAATRSPTSDVWEVKDYGHRFGNYNGSGNTTQVVRRELHQREKDRARDSHRDREIIQEQYGDKVWIPARQPGWRHENGTEEDREGSEQPTQVDLPRHMRPRRGSFPGYGGHERGGSTVRRARGFGRFHGGRGRGGFFHHQRPASFPHVRTPLPPAQPPFEVHSPVIDMANGYGQVPYAPPEFETYEVIQPALPPRAAYSVPAYSVHAMKNRLLGQLEYYLSPQNMAQDYYLRQRMDNEGWIPILLLASFKRVQQLQTNVDMVREVLDQSTVVEVHGDWVRMAGRQWEPFVLPGAPPSVVTGPDSSEGAHSGLVLDHHHHHGDVSEVVEGDHGEIEGDCDGEDCEGDAEEEEDEIEFVIGEEAEGAWMSVVPERKQ